MTLSGRLPTRVDYLNSQGNQCEVRRRVVLSVDRDGDQKYKEATPATASVLDPQTYRWLLSELGEKYKPRKTRHIRPRWDSETGSLWLDDHIIRDVRIFRGCTNIQQILDAFQKARWASRIDNPLPSCGQEETRQVVFRLNRGLAEIRFHVQKGGRAITWTHA